MVVLPARSRKPKDKALVEQTVRRYQRVYAKLRSHGIDELNGVDAHNATRFQRLRRELFDRIERTAERHLDQVFNYHIGVAARTGAHGGIYHDHLRVAAHQRGGPLAATPRLPTICRIAPLLRTGATRILRWTVGRGPGQGAEGVSGAGPRRLAPQPLEFRSQLGQRSGQDTNPSSCRMPIFAAVPPMNNQATQEKLTQMHVASGGRYRRQVPPSSALVDAEWVSATTAGLADQARQISAIRAPMGATGRTGPIEGIGVSPFPGDQPGCCDGALKQMAMWSSVTPCLVARVPTARGPGSTAMLPSPMLSGLTG